MKSVIITGAAGQLGQEFVDFLAGKNYHVIAVDLKFEDEQKIAGVEYVAMDITDEDKVVDLFMKLPSIYAVINNAGIGVFTPFEERTVQDFKNVLNVNLVGAFLMAREAIKKMKQAKEGKIINIGSIYGVVSSDPRIYGDSGRNNSEVYSMTKAGMIMFTKYLAAHYASYNVQVNAISPGGVLRAQSDDFLVSYNNKTPAGRLANEKELLPAIEFLLSKENSYTNGQNLVVDGGFTAW